MSMKLARQGYMDNDLYERWVVDTPALTERDFVLWLQEELKRFRASQKKEPPSSTEHMHDAIALLAEIDERIKIDGAIFRGSDFHGKITTAVLAQQHHA